MATTLRRTLGANVRSLLEVRGMSQAGLATRIGKSQSTVSQIIHGRVPVAIDTIEALADALHVPHAALLSRPPVNLTKRRGSPEAQAPFVLARRVARGPDPCRRPAPSTRPDTRK